MLALSGCGSDEGRRSPLVAPQLATGNFCDQLHYVIVQGTSRPRGGFEEIRGRRIDEYRHVGSVLIEGASICFVDYGLGTYDARYTCVFADAPISRWGELVSVMNRLESDVEACIANQNRFGFSSGGREKPRYRPMGRVENDRVWFLDLWRDQDVEVEIEQVGNGGRVLLTIDSL